MLLERKPLSEKIPSDGVLSFQFERITEIAKELPPLVKNFWREYPIKDLPLDINWEKIFELDAIGIIHLLTVRDEDKLVGGVFNTVFAHLFSESSKFANIEVFYLDMAYRQGWTGLKMLKKNEIGMRKLGCKAIRFGLPTKELEPFALRLGYKVLDTNYIKILE